jgi:dinuclear metal center YbgI/SA1388 family protein
LNKYEIVRKIEEFAPLMSQEKWDCSGWAVDTNSKRKIENENTDNEEVSKVLFALTVTDKIVQQARAKNCDMIISHHPLFYVPLDWRDINIYSAHTNLDKAEGGTTDRLISELGFNKTESYEFVRIVRLSEPITVEELRQKLLKISPKMRYINNYDKKTIQTIGFCAGSGSEFIGEYDTDAFVTGDLKFHTALECRQVVFDIGHFESEIFAPKILKEITQAGEKGIIADEKSPFI